MKASPVRLGLIGGGRWGRNYVKTIAALDGARLVRLGDPDAAAWTVADGSCATTADWREVAAADDLDGVIIAAPPSWHARMVRAAVEAGRAVLVEKPLTLDAAEAADLGAFVAAHGGLVMVDHIHLFNPAFRRLKALVGGSGPIREIHAVMGNHGPFRTDASVLWDWGAHGVAMCLDLLGTAVSEVTAERLETRPIEGTTGEILDLHLRFNGGTDARIRIGNIMDKTCRFEAATDAGRLIFDDLAESKLVRHPGGAVAVTARPPLAVVVEEFAEAIRAGADHWADLDLGVAVTAVLACCQTALEET
jgi:predicted dehydrogenase